MDDSKGAKSSSLSWKNKGTKREKENRSPLREPGNFLLRQGIQLPLGSEPSGQMADAHTPQDGQAAVSAYAA